MSGLPLSVSEATQREKMPVQYILQFPTKVETASVLGWANKPNPKPFSVQKIYLCVNKGA